MAAPSSPDYTLELLKIAGTFLSVWGGATLAWRSASRGRREDLLIKERYKLFEAQVGYIYEANFLVTNLYHALNNLSFDRGSLEQSSRDLMVRNANGYVQDLRDLHDRIIRNRKVTIFNSRETADLYSWCTARLINIVLMADFLISLHEMKGSLDAESFGLQSKSKVLNQDIREVQLKHQALLRDLYMQQEFSTWIREPALLPGPDDITPHALRDRRTQG